MKRTIKVNFLFVTLACLSFAAFPFAASVGNAPATAAGGKSRIDPPQIFPASTTQTAMNVTVCASNSGSNPTGLPAGFSVQWMTVADYAANGNQWISSDDPRLCKASFSGNADLSRYRLAPGECVTINIGDFLFDNGASTNCAGVLQCATSYLVRAFGHATSEFNRSDFTNNLSSSTRDCGGQCDDGDTCPFCNCCVLDAEHWPQYGPTGCTSFTLNQWPATSLTLGNATYSDLQLCEILNAQANDNGLIALAQELIAAKLNLLSMRNQLQSVQVTLCNGYTCDEMAMIARCTADADTLIGGLVIPPHGNGFLEPTVTNSLVSCLHPFNASELGVGGCPD